MNNKSKANLAACGIFLLAGVISSVIEVGKTIVENKRRAKRIKLYKQRYEHKFTEHISYTIIPDDIKS